MLHVSNNPILRIVLAGFLSLLLQCAFSQVPLDYRHVEVAFNKTSSIIFPAVITSVDRGSRDVLAQKAKGVDNILQLKAGRTNFKETNLTVITADGQLHHFLVKYSDHPSALTIRLAEPDVSEFKSRTSPLLFQAEMTPTELESMSELILENHDGFRLGRTGNSDMKLELQGIYIQNNVMFYHLKIANKSNIPFHTEMLRFYIKDRQKVKRTATQEAVELPLYLFGNTDQVNGNATQDVIIALQKFTIPDAKILVIEWMENRGGRHLHLGIKNRKIVHAKRVIPEQ